MDFEKIIEEYFEDQKELSRMFSSIAKRYINSDLSSKEDKTWAYKVREEEKIFIQKLYKNKKEYFSK